MVFLCLTLAGCTTVEDSPPQRWIPEDPQEAFSAERFDSRQEVFRWSFRDEAALDAWHFHDVGNEYGLSNEGLVVRSSSGDPQLYRRLGVAAENVDFVRVAIAGLEQGEIQLFWAGFAEPFQVTKSLRLRPGKMAGRSSGFKVFEFRVGDHPGWEGRITRLRLDPTSAAGERVVVRWLSGATEGASRAALREMAGRPWKVALGNDRRNALLAVPGRSLEREITVPADGRLQLAYGTVCPTRSAYARFAPARLQVLVGPRGREPKPAWEARLDRDDRGRALVWNEAEIDLSRYGGRPATVSLRTTAAARSPDRLSCVVAFANPEVTSEAFEQRGLNVILISVDTLRADRLSLYGYERHTSPAIDAWARERGTTFATTVAPSNWTLPSHVSMLTGLDTLSHGVNFDTPAPASMDFLAEAFREAGYSTAAITGGGYMSAAKGFTQGFDRYDHWPETDRDRELEENLDQFLEWLSRHRDRHFFALFHTYETHEPYLPRQPYFDRFYDGPLEHRVEDLAWRPIPDDSPLDNRRVEWIWRPRPGETPPSSKETKEIAAALYDSGVAHMDAQLGRLFRRLRELGLEDRTVVALTSDHGEALGEHGGLQGHQYPYDHILLVPLVIAAPGLDAAGKTVHTQVRMVDIAPTLLELTGLEPVEGMDGRSLVPLIRGETTRHDPEAWSYVGKPNWGIALRAGNELKYVYNDAPWPGLRGREFLFRLEEDPRELNNTAESAREAEVLRDRVLQRMSTVPALRVRLSSTADERLVGRLNGELVHPRKIKTVDMPCDCLQWIPENTVAFEVPPGTTYNLLFHEAPADGTLSVEELSLEGQPKDRSPEETQLDLEQLTEGSQTLVLVDGSWELQDGYRTSQTPSVTFSWSGDAAVSTTDAPVENPELADQLRALGYLE